MSATHCVREVPVEDGGTVSVRTIRPGDEGTLSQFYEHLSDGVRLFFEPFLVVDAVLAGEIIAKHIDGREVHIVVEDASGEFVAHCFLWAMDTEEPELGIGIRESHQGQGLGRLLMDLLIDEARAAGKPCVRLTVFVENERARRLYESLGFEYVGQRDVTRSARFGGLTMTLLEMRLALDHAPTMRPGA